MRENGQRVLEIEANAILAASRRLGEAFEASVNKIGACNGKLVVTGLGKSGHVARKLAATFASTGTPAFFLHPSEALHGDLGVVAGDDCLLAIAFGGETHEVLEVARFAKRRDVPIIAITGNLDSSLAQISDYVLDGSVEEEACHLNLAPTASTTLALALGDALAVAAMGQKGFLASDFADNHPGGSLGRRLRLVKDLMRPLDELSTVRPGDNFASVLANITNPNFGIVPVIDDRGEICGAITDGDLRRAVARDGEAAFACKAEQLMSRNPTLIAQDRLALDGVAIMEARITSLFVVAEADSRCLVGLLRMHDLLQEKII